MRKFLKFSEKFRFSQVKKELQDYLQNSEMAYGQDYEESRIFLSYLFIEKSLDTVLAELLINNVLFLELTFEERERERRREKERTLYIHINNVQHACIHVLAHPRNLIREIGFCLKASIARKRLLRRFCAFFRASRFFHGRCPNASRTNPAIRSFSNWWIITFYRN